MKKGCSLAVLLAALLALTLGACGGQGRQTGTRGAPTAPANVYVSRAAGFRIALPEAWSGHYHVVDVSGRTVGLHQADALNVVEFLFLPTDTARAAPDVAPRSLLTVYVFKSLDWAAMLARSGPPLGEAIAERDGKVYVAELPEANPFGAADPDSARFERMRMDPAAVKRAFTLE